MKQIAKLFLTILLSTLTLHAAIQRVTTDYVQIIEDGTYVGNSLNQTYSIDPTAVSNGSSITIIDQKGNNTIELVGGLTITSSQVVSDELILTLSNATTINVRGADTFTYDVGGNYASDIPSNLQDFNTFVSNTLDISTTLTNDIIYNNKSITIESNINNSAPTVNAGDDITANIGANVTLNAIVEDTDGSIVSYEWKEGSTILATESHFSKSDFSVGNHIISLTVTDNYGATSSDIVIVTIEEDTTINSFDFSNVIDAYPSTTHTSNAIPITGINTTIDILTTNGIIIKNDNEEGSSTTAVKGDVIKIKLDASMNFNTTTSAVVTMGSQTKTFSITTIEKLFKDIAIAEKSTFYESNVVTVWADNMNISIDNGVLIINNVALSDQTTIANIGDKIKIKLQSGASLGDTVVSNISFDGFSDTWELNTKPSNYNFINNGTYGTEDTTYYYLTMTSAGNVDFTENYGYTTVSIYDTDMNLVDTITNSETKYIDAGSYIVKIYNRSSYDSITIYSTVLDN